MTDEKIRAIFKASVGGICGSSAITFARAILAAEAREPVAWIDSMGHPHQISHIQTATEKRLFGPWLPLFATPPLPEAPDTVRVPREPTPEMLIRGGEAVFYALGPGEAMRSEQDQDDAASIYRAMLAAAPKDTP